VNGVSRITNYAIARDAAVYSSALSTDNVTNSASISLLIMDLIISRPQMIYSVTYYTAYKRNTSHSKYHTL
jgi:hypothetical protein